MTDSPLTQAGGDQPHRRDLVTVGASAGGVQALRQFTGLLPEDFSPTVLVVVHRTSQRPARLADVLDRAGPLEARFAENGIPLAAGRIYVAPPDRHLMVSSSTLRITDGARVNRSRPAIDPLSHTAGRPAREHGESPPDARRTRPPAARRPRPPSGRPVRRARRRSRGGHRGAPQPDHTTRLITCTRSSSGDRDTGSPARRCR